MNLRSHILFLECAFRENKIKVGVIAVPDKGEKSGGVNFSRTINELDDDIFTRHFVLKCPFYVIAYKQINC